MPTVSIRALHLRKWRQSKGRSGCAPACAIQWQPGVCEKPRIKCSDCGHRLLADETCYLVEVDFDEAEWRDDVFKSLAEDAQRTAAIAAEIICAYRDGPKVLVLAMPIS